MVYTIKEFWYTFFKNVPTLSLNFENLKNVYFYLISSVGYGVLAPNPEIFKKHPTL